VVPWSFFWIAQVQNVFALTAILPFFVIIASVTPAWLEDVDPCRPSKMGMIFSETKRWGISHQRLERLEFPQRWMFSGCN
jgi:hypothetical protein